MAVPIAVIDVRHVYQWSVSRVSQVTLYHIVVMSIRLGATALSKTPSRTLVVTRPAQFFAAEVHTTIVPHCTRMHRSVELKRILQLLLEILRTASQWQLSFAVDESQRQDYTSSQ